MQVRLKVNLIFGDQLMDSKNTKIILAIVCILLVIAVTFIFNNPFSGKSSTAVTELKMICNNEQCGQVFSISTNEFRKQMQDKGTVASAPVVICPACGEESATKYIEEQE